MQYVETITCRMPSDIPLFSEALSVHCSATVMALLTTEFLILLLNLPSLTTNSTQTLLLSLIITFWNLFAVLSLEFIRLELDTTPMI
jgi:hypothetical protein